MSCEHETFTAQVDVTRIVGDGTPRRYSCDVRVQCADCGRKMLWPSELPIGLDLIEHLTRSVDGAELRGPLHPEGEAVVLPGPGSNELRGATPRAHPRRRPRQPGQRGEVSVRCVDLREADVPEMTTAEMIAWLERGAAEDRVLAARLLDADRMAERVGK